MNKLILFSAGLFLAFSCANKKQPDVLSESIRLNQLGYYPASVKEFILADLEATTFQVIDSNRKVVFEGELTPGVTWAPSGESVQKGVFTELVSPGEYLIKVGDSLVSYPFEIKEDVYREALDASIKSFYFQRASMAIEEAYGGVYARAAGHPDDSCIFHPSSGKSEGALNSHGGWYDAGDYGKYIVNAALSVGQMMDLLEIYPDAVADGELNIPESGNGISDLADEIKYELDWMLTMQDTDGGVFFKLTAKNFSGFVMPEAYDLERMIIGKCTASSLSFAASMAQAARVFSSIDSDYAELCRMAAIKAWQWSLANPDIAFKNPADVSTGEYGDGDFHDDFFWAASELWLTTGKQEYLDYLKENEPEYEHVITNSWKFFARNMGFHSLLAHGDQLEEELRKSLTEKHLALANDILAKIDQIPYAIALDHFEWGSNSDVLNQAMILCYAHLLTDDPKYLTGAIQNTDYIFEKNAVGYSFLTGFGDKQVMFPHHRPSGADGIEIPVPGFIAGGPNKDKQDKFGVSYTYEEPARSFEDLEASFASNEVCLNWNAPAVFVLGYLESVE